MSNNFSQEQRTRLEQLQVTNPDVILTARTSTATPVSIAIAVVAHVVILGVTSVALFADWSNYGVHLPATIRTMKEEEAAKAAAAEQTKLEAEQTAKAEKDAEDKAAAEAKKTGKKDPAEIKAHKPTQDIGNEDPFSDLE